MGEPPRARRSERDGTGAHRSGDLRARGTSSPGSGEVGVRIALRSWDERAMVDLQRAIGNRATRIVVTGAGDTTRPARIQRNGLSGRAVRKAAGSDRHLRALADQIDGYSGALWSFRSRPSDQERLVALRAMSRSLYAWYGSQDTMDLASLDSPAARAVRAAESAIDEEHARLVEQIASKGHKITSSDPEADLVSWRGEAGIDVDAVWRNLVAGTGGLRIDGSPEFVRQARSMLVRILATPVGARLLTRLSVSGDRKVVTIGEGQPPSAIKPLLFESSASESKAIPQVASEPGRPDDATKDNLRRLTELVPVDPATVDVATYPLYKEPIDLLRAAMDRRPGICVRFAPGVVHCLQFAPGAHGAYVALVRRPGGLDNPDVTGRRSVHTPMFVTLAHELGHALNQLAGTATLDAERIFGMLAGDVGTYENPTAERRRWSNAEEFLIISGLENEIRTAVGLAARGGHAGVVDQELIDRVDIVRKLVETLGGAIYQADRSRWAEQMATELMQLKKETLTNLSMRDKRLMLERYESEMIRVARLLSKDAKVAGLVLDLLLRHRDVVDQFEKYAPQVIEIVRRSR